MLICVFTTNTYSKNPYISSSDSIFSNGIRVSLLTFGAGDEAHSVWGHTAIRIKDEAKKMDKVYNYGAYDFDTPYFLIKFLRGKLKYSLAVDNYSLVYKYYKWLKRDIYEQELNFSYQEKIKLYELLEENYKEKNRYYNYDFFFDNCATRPLEIIQKSLDDKIVFTNVENKKTFRQLLDQQIIKHKWLDFGIDLIIGSKADKNPTKMESAFLPLELKNHLSNAEIIKKNSNNKIDISSKIVLKEQKLFQAKNNILGTPQYLKPIYIFSLLLAIEIIIFLISWKKRKIITKWYDYLYFSMAFVGGLTITFLWFFTDHSVTKNNWNYLWLNPLYLFLFFRKSIINKYIFILITFLVFASLIGFGFLPQEINPAVLPILGILILKLSKYGILRHKFEK